MARDSGIDIAVDLNGFTEGGRTDIFAWRAAPVQVNYLGFPSTMGCDYMDYIVADATLIARREEGIISPQAELVELVWMALAEASALDLPSITRVVLDELAAAMKTGMDPARPRPFFYLRNRVWRRDEL